MFSIGIFELILVLAVLGAVLAGLVFLVGVVYWVVRSNRRQ